MPVGSLRRSSRLNPLQPQVFPSPQQQQHAVKASLGFTPVKEVLPGGEPDSECSFATNTLAAVSATEEGAAEAAGLALPSTCETRPVICPVVEPTHPSVALSPCGSRSGASTSPQLLTEAQNTSAVEVTNLASPTFLVIHRTIP